MASQIYPGPTTSDSAGNIYFVDAGDVEKLTPNGMISIIAGAGAFNPAIPHQTPQPGLAIASAMSPVGVAVDGVGNVYIADALGYVEKVNPSGVLSIIAGVGHPNGQWWPTVGPALDSTIYPRAIAIDRTGNLYLTDDRGYVVEISSDGHLSYVAGNAANGDPVPGPAMNSPVETGSIALDQSGNIYLAGGAYVEEISGGTLSIAAGPDPSMHGGMGPMPAVPFEMKASSVAVSSSGALYLASGDRVYRIADGTVSTFAGYAGPGYTPGQTTYPPKPGPATSSPMLSQDVAFDSAGNLVISDSGVHAPGWTSPSGYLESVTPSGTLSLLAGDSQGVLTLGPATMSPMTPEAVAADSQGNLYVSTGTGIAKVDGSGTLSMFAGNGTTGAPIPGPALSSPLRASGAMAVDSANNLYLAQTGSVVKITPGGVLSIIAGNGQNGTPVAGPAVSSPMSPTAIAADPAGDLYIESGNIYRVGLDGTLSLFAGGGTSTPSSWPAPATSIGVSQGPIGVDASGNVYATDGATGVYKITPNGSATVLAGGTNQTSLVPGPAIDSDLSALGMAGDAAGNMYFIDYTYVIKVTPDGTLSIIGGDGDGEGDRNSYWYEAATLGWAQQTGLTPAAIAVSPQGTVYIANTVRNQAGGYVLALTPTSATAPSAPTNVTASAGAASADVTFAPSLDTGGIPVTNYVVSDGAGHTCSPTLDMRLGYLDLYTRHSLSCWVTGLTPQAPVTFTVTATNAVGTSGSSAPSNSVTPFTVPSAPTGLTATAGNGQVQLSWTAPATDGGSLISGYDITSQDVTGNQGVAPSCTSAQQSTATSCTVANLYNGHSYTFTVAARNWAGPGSATSISSTPAGPPDGPQNVTAVAGNRSAVVGWTAPANEGSTITHYTVTVSPGGATTTINGTVPQGQWMSATVGGLVNGATYSFTVTATNSVGTSVPSTRSGWVTPAAPSATTRVAISGAHPYASGARRYYPIRVYVKTSGTPSGYVYLYVSGTPGVTKTYKVPANSTTGVVVSIALTGKSGILSISASHSGSPGFAAAPPYSFNPRIIA
ncbi:hypothetical protein Back2_00850 [Nocardioides baekrokdamisoli]|uniref:Fibronectin type-III domain-containing protein n=2 Tax=Nocardioides baekrokdamisoli TaxID=1804624 RepID=A0A3G9IX06_9ACTN|nr:hypothetical protein Back2_00850 [Nocardioides baekrokdamisoli]